MLKTAAKGPRTGSGWAIENRLFTEWRLRFYGSGAVAGYAIAIVWILATRARFIPECIDFGRIWLSGVFAMSADPVRAYDFSAYSAAQADLFGPGNCYPDHFVYPPTALFVAYPLGWMSYSLAFVVWNSVTLLLYLAVMYLIIPKTTTVILAVIPFVVFVNMHQGQHSLLVSALLGLSLIFLERRVWLSGIFIGILTYKPQFGVLFPLVLAASRNWRALGSAGAMSVALGGAAAIAFGYQGWQFFFDTLLVRDSTMRIDSVYVHSLSVYGLLHWAGADGWSSWTIQLGIAAVVTLTVCVLWAKPLPHSLKAAVLCAGSLIVTPYVGYNDYCILPIGVAFLIKDGLERGFLPAERSALLACLIGSFLTLRAQYIYSFIPFFSASCVILLCVVRRAAVWPGSSVTAPPPVAKASTSALIGTEISTS